ncbi:flagellar motor switch protein FliN [Pontiella agarivorans]|uniref:Flagellar motor switch protein FliN n=1 Tax=Pontiella agarivorans TaxID=3038953 RepID=A0ABU5MSX0_9BACT|nr:flagellar motor switch protein FliN [Pontiella agarivorans]MDZ8117295.1 flagellar motor switch protein FliN [Pontiella agarivorans]
MSAEMNNEQTTAADQVEVHPVSPAPLTEPVEGASEVSEEVNLNMIMDIPVDVHVEVGRTSLPVREFLRLGVGSVLQLDRLVGESADLIINGKLVGRGDVVVVDETFGIRISELAGEKELMSSW